MFRLVTLRLLESYFRHRWLYLIPIVLMIPAAVAYITLKPPGYVAHGTLYIQKESLISSLNALRNEGFSWLTPADATISELYELLSSDAFTRAIVAQTDLEQEMNGDRDALHETLGAVRSAIWAEHLGNNLVRIAAAHEDADIAFQLVTATIETFTQWKINVGRSESVAAQAFFVDLVSSYQSALEPARAALNDYLIAHPEPVRGDRPMLETAEIARLDAAVQQADTRLRAAQEKEENARLTLTQTESDVRQTYFVIDTPTLPDATDVSKREMAMTLIMFMVVGGMISLTGVIGAALLDRSLRFPIDVRHGLSLPVLGMIPRAEGAPPGTERDSQRAVTPVESTLPVLRGTSVIQTSPTAIKSNPLLRPNGVHGTGNAHGHEASAPPGGVNGTGSHPRQSTIRNDISL